MSCRIQSRSKYKSPIHKVLNLLERGRDNGKAKYREAKEQIKYLQNKLRRIEQSQQDWKQKAQASTAAVKHLKAVIEQHERRQADDAQKKPEPAAGEACSIRIFRVRYKTASILQPLAHV